MQDTLEYLKQRSEMQLQGLPGSRVAPADGPATRTEPPESRARAAELKQRKQSDFSYTHFRYSSLAMPPENHQADPTWSVELLPGADAASSILVLGQLGQEPGFGASPQSTVGLDVAKARKSLAGKPPAVWGTALLRPRFATLKNNYSSALQRSLEQCQLLIVPTPEKIVRHTLQLEQLQAKRPAQKGRMTAPNAAGQAQEKLAKKRAALQEQIRKSWRAYAEEIFACLDFIASKKRLGQGANAGTPQLYCSQPALFSLGDYLRELRSPQQGGRRQHRNSELQSVRRELEQHFPQWTFHSLQTVRLGSEGASINPTLAGAGALDSNAEKSCESSFTWGHWQFCLVLEARKRLGALHYCNKLSGYWAGPSPAFVEFELGRKFTQAPGKAKTKAKTAQNIVSIDSNTVETAEDVSQTPDRTADRPTWRHKLRKSLEQNLADTQFSGFAELKLSSWTALPLSSVLPDASPDVSSAASQTPHSVGLGHFRIAAQRPALWPGLWQSIRTWEGKLYRACRFGSEAKAAASTQWLDSTGTKYALRGQYTWVRRASSGNAINTPDPGAAARNLSSWEEAYSWQFRTPGLESSTLYYQAELLEEGYHSANLAQQCQAVWQQEKILWQNFLDAARHCAMLGNAKTNPQQKSFCLVIERELQHFLQYSEQWQRESEAGQDRNNGSRRQGFHSKAATQQPLFRLRDSRSFWADFMAQSKSQPFPTMLLWSLWQQLEPRLARKVRRYRKVKRFLRQHWRDFSQVMRQLGLQRQWQLRSVLRYRWSGNSILGWASPLWHWRHWPQFVWDTCSLQRQRSKYGRYVQGAASWRKLWPRAVRYATQYQQSLSALDSGAKQVWAPRLALAEVSSFAWPRLDKLLLETVPLLGASLDLPGSDSRSDSGLESENANWQDADLLTHLKEHFYTEALAFQRVAGLEQQLERFQQRNMRETCLAQDLADFLAQSQATADSPRAARPGVLHWLGQELVAKAGQFGVSLQQALARKGQAVSESLLLLGQMLQAILNQGLSRIARTLAQRLNQLLLATEAHKLQRLQRRSQEAENLRQKAQETQERRYMLQQAKQERQRVQQQARKQARELRKTSQLQRRQAKHSRRQQVASRRHELRTERLRQRTVVKLQRQQAKLQTQKMKLQAQHEQREAQRQMHLQRQQRWQQLHDRWLDNWQTLTAPQRRLAKRWAAFYQRQRRAVWGTATGLAALTLVALFVPKDIYSDMYQSMASNLRAGIESWQESWQTEPDNELLEQGDTTEAENSDTDVSSSNVQQIESETTGQEKLGVEQNAETGETADIAAVPQNSATDVEEVASDTEAANPETANIANGRAPTNDQLNSPAAQTPAARPQNAGNRQSGANIAGTSFTPVQPLSNKGKSTSNESRVPGSSQSSRVTAGNSQPATTRTPETESSDTSLQTQNQTTEQTAKQANGQDKDQTQAAQAQKSRTQDQKSNADATAETDEKQAAESTQGQSADSDSATSAAQVSEPPPASEAGQDTGQAQSEVATGSSDGQKSDQKVAEKEGGQADTQENGQTQDHGKSEAAKQKSENLPAPEKPAASDDAAKDKDAPAKAPASESAESSAPAAAKDENSKEEVSSPAATAESK